MKPVKDVTRTNMIVVSNPWREAIEGIGRWYDYLIKVVSNPWREAIEAMNRINVSLTSESFQSLEGGY